MFYLVMSIAHATRMGAQFGVSNGRLVTLNGCTTYLQCLSWKKKTDIGYGKRWPRAGILEITPAFVPGAESLPWNWRYYQSLRYPDPAQVELVKGVINQIPAVRRCHEASIGMRSGVPLFLLLKTQEGRMGISDERIPSRLKERIDELDAEELP